MALRRPQSADEYRATLDSVLQEAERASALIDGLLLLARADAGTDEAAPAAIDVGTVLAELEPRLTAHAESRGLTMTVERPPAPTLAPLDRGAFVRLIWILVDNAVKYTAPPGHVDITLENVRDTTSSAGTEMVPGTNSAAGHVVELTIRDTGIGIAQEDLPRVFDRFYRTDPARSRESGGAGLGLAIAKSIVERHGGRIRIQSEPGHGTRVRVELAGA